MVTSSNCKNNINISNLLLLMKTDFYSAEFLVKAFLVLVVLASLAILVIGMVSSEEKYPAAPLYGAVAFFYFMLVIYGCIC
jgi:hypothetical protein